MVALETTQLKSETFYPFLCQAFNHERFEVFSLAGDASNRRYFRIVEGEHSWVLMVWEPFVDNNEYPFLSVLNHFQRSEIHVPTVKAKSPHEGLVLLEDLGDLTLERKFWENQTQDPSLPFYKMAMDELIKIHYASTLDRKNDCTAFHVEFDVAKLLWEMNYARKHLLEQFCHLDLTVQEQKLLDQTFLSICEELHQEPKFIAHRDYHSRNLMLKHGKMRVIDFQDARLGSIQYDLVSLLKDSYVDLNSEMAEQLLAYYLDQRAEIKGLPRIQRSKFQRTYEIQSIQRCFKACGSFASFYNTRTDTRYLKYLSGTLKRVRQSLELFPEHKPFLNLLDSRGLFDTDYAKV